MEFKAGNIVHDASHFLFVGILPNGVARGREFEFVADNEHVVGGVALQTKVFEIGLLGSHNHRFNAVSLLEELKEHVETFDIDIERTVGNHIDHRREVEVMATDGSLEVVELTLSRIVTVVAVNGTNGHAYLMSLSEVECTATIRNGGTSSSHNIDKFEVVGLVDGRPVDSVLRFGHQDAKGCFGLCCTD